MTPQERNVKARSALEQALDALEQERTNYENWDNEYGAPEYIYGTITAIKEVLAQQSNEQVEPVGLVSRAAHMDVIVVNLIREGINKHRARDLADHFLKYTHPPVPYVTPSRMAQPKEPEHSAPHGEPVAIQYASKAERDLYEMEDEDDTTPAQRTWVGLTNKDIYECEPKTDWYDSVEFAQAIEAKLKEKNT